jgi:DNA-binding transcriptional LysR family regulator
VEQGGEVISGTVLTCTDSVLQGLLPVAQFMPQYPALTLELSTSNDFANLSRRDADIALRLTVRHRTSGRPLPGRRIYQVCASPAYARLHEGRALADLAWIGPDDFLPDHPTVAWRREHLPGVRLSYRCNSMLSPSWCGGIGVRRCRTLGDGLHPLGPALAGHDTRCGC